MTEGGGKKDKSHRECQRITWTSTNTPFWLRVQIPCRYLSNDLCMFFLFFFMVLSWNSRGFVPESMLLTAHQWTKKKERNNREQTSSYSNMQHSTCTEITPMLKGSLNPKVFICTLSFSTSMHASILFNPPPTSYWDHYKWDWVCSPRLQIM